MRGLGLCGGGDFQFVGDQFGAQRLDLRLDAAPLLLDPALGGLEFDEAPGLVAPPVRR